MEKKLLFLNNTCFKAGILELSEKEIDSQLENLKEIRNAFAKIKEDYRSDVVTSDIVMENFYTVYNNKIKEVKTSLDKEIKNLKKLIDKKDIEAALKEAQQDFKNLNEYNKVFVEQFQEARNFKIDKRMIDTLVDFYLIILDKYNKKFDLQKDFFKDYADAIMKDQEENQL